jgi:hypothetical protein
MSETKTQLMTVPVNGMYDCLYCGSSDLMLNIPMEDMPYVVKTLECQDCLFSWEIEDEVNRDVPEPVSAEITSRQAVEWTDASQSMTRKPRAELNIDRFETTTVNANGQIYLGRDLEGVKVHVAIEIVEDPDEQEQEDPDE